MKSVEVARYWVDKHNKHYSAYINEERELRYSLKAYFLNSYYFFRTLQEGWGDYFVGYSNLFRRDPSNDYYSMRDPAEKIKSRLNIFEWVAQFEIFDLVGFPHNKSAKDNFKRFSNKFLRAAMSSPNTENIDFFLCSAVAHLPLEYQYIEEWVPSQIEKYLNAGDLSPHQLMMYLKTLKQCNNCIDLRNKAISRLIEWIKNPSGTTERQLLVWARLITRMKQVPELETDDLKQLIRSNLARSLEEFHGFGESNWQYSPMILEAAYIIANPDEEKQIMEILTSTLAPASFSGLRELFDFLVSSEEALTFQQTIREIKEKCKGAIKLDECIACMANKKGDCWIRVLSKLTNTKPTLHSGYEVGDKVIYKLQQGIYFVIKAEEIPKQVGEGDVLLRQCVSLFSVDHALVLYLNPFETAPAVIEAIKKNASTSKTNPRFEIIDAKYLRQMYKKYREIQ